MRFWEWYFGLPAARPGQGTDWGLRWTWPGGGAVPAWGLVLLLLGMIGGVLLVYRRDARLMPLGRQLPLMLLRILSICLVVMMLGRWTLVLRRTGLPTLAVMIDTSASMGLEDSYRDRKARDTARVLAKSLDRKSASRLDLAKATLLHNNSRLLRRLQDGHQLRLYRFDADAWSVPAEQPTAIREPATDTEDSLPDFVRHLTADGAATRPLPALRSLLEDLRGSPPVAIVVLTDGITTSGSQDRFPMAAEEARSQAVPLVILGVGSEEPARDLQLADLLADDVVFAGDPVTFTFQVRNFGFEDQSARITLREASAPDVLASIELPLTDSQEPLAGELTYTPAEPGEYEFVLEAEPLPGESTLTNNSLTARVSVRKEQLRVLLVDRLPRWEYRHLKSVLERDPAISLQSVLQESDSGYADEDRSALRRFPVVRDELFAYDVVILGDVNLAYLGPTALDDLRAFVAERGGGLVMIAGEEHNPFNYRGTPLEDLLPVSIGFESDAVAPSASTGFVPTLTPAGNLRAALRLADQAAENHLVWGNLPPLYWCAVTGPRKPGAETLAAYPGRSTSDGPQPVIITQRYGAGQVVFHATDELWRWRERVEDRYYGRYWLQLMRYLSRSRLRSEGSAIELSTDRHVYQPGDRVELRVRFADPLLVPGDSGEVAVVVEGPNGFRERVTLEPSSEAPLLFAGRIGTTSTGAWRAWLAAPVLTLENRSPETPADGNAPASLEGAASGDPAIPSVTFRVDAPEGELRDRLFRQSELVSAARISHGTYVPFWKSEEIVASLPRTRAVPISAETVVPLWNRWEVLLGLTGLLTLEWIIRKRTGLV